MREREERTNRFSGKLKSPRWRSEDRWEEWVWNEREGRKNRRQGSWSVGYTVFLGTSASPWWRSEDNWEEWVSNEKEGRKNRRLGVFVGSLTFDFGVFNRFSFNPCWDGLLMWIPGGAISVEKIQQAQSAWIWYKFPHWNIFFIFHKSGFQKPYI